ncbi:heterokaryon incompatibility protein-domain-containing protein [Hypoxylon sp. FL1857]|nr:heterokaryon incompatibility protein-domain-containing protein [Hypoxylon sp. FL1857]
MREDFPEMPETQISQLCQNCGKIFLNEFSFTLATSKPSCYLCQVLSPYLQSYAQTLNEGARNNAKLVRVGSSLATSSTAAPMLSIVVGPGYSNVPSHIQRGFPNLANSPSTTQALLFRHWLDDCDKKHGETCRVSDTPTRRPTRLIDVSLNSLKLECNPEDSPYVALSHPWGDPERHARFCTTKSNKESLEESIDYDKLPKNFQDAVAVTRSLGIKYLWIDSLCIVQKEKGDKGDFHIESRFMEDYYSGAYCTLAASSADGSSSGFLTRRPAEDTTRRCHGLQSSSGPESTFYICNSIDDFARDVETSHLSTRGWVFQERALSRRTIHFAGTQAYWECGHGVRCETMSRLFNRRSSFLSDPNFPSSATQYYKGMRIEFFQYIYSRYSTLEFSQETDRSVAMFGLERRLARVYGVRARYGILDKTYLHRSLLWQIENKNKPLRKIDFGDDTKVPSWSWMAVMGPIKYMDAPFDLMKWNYDIKSPFGDPFTDKDGVWTQPVLDFRVPARDVLQEVDPGRLIYDRPEDNDAISVRDKLKCVIIGYEKMESDEDPSDWYTLLVSPTSDGLEDDYERIGVARMTADDIDLEKHTMVRIV